MTVPYTTALNHVLAVAGEHAADVDQRTRFPQETVAALGETGLLGLTVPRELGGMGGHEMAMFEVTSALAERCASSGMIFTMHVGALALLQTAQDGRFDDVLGESAAGRHLSTLALSERATRSNFWVAMGTASDTPDGGAVLDLEKSFVTSAGPANSYVVSAATPGRTGTTASDLFLVRVGDRGVEVLDWWQGSGLRGNSSAPMRFTCELPPEARIGARGEGQPLLLDVVIPWFHLGSACVALGIARAARDVTRAHLVGTSLAHLRERLVDQPVVRFGLGRLHAEVAQLDGFVESTAASMEAGTATIEDILLLKAVANETALTATDRAMRLGGGAAYSGRVPMDRLFRDARAGVVMAPTADMLYEMVGRVAAGHPPFST
jgi:alkylation response protein AidB-like acyl-CoA dehydrogenase